MKRLGEYLVYRFTIIVGMAIKFIWKIYFFHFRHSVWDYKTKEKWNHMLRKMGQEYREGVKIRWAARESRPVPQHEDRLFDMFLS